MKTTTEKVAEPTKAQGNTTTQRTADSQIAPVANTSSMQSQSDPSTALTSQSPPTIPGLVPGDVLIPKLLLMQGLSDFVTQRKAQIGDIVRSTNQEKLGNPEKTFRFIPISAPRSEWIIEVNANGQKFEYVKTIPRDSKNSGEDWSFTADKDGNEVAPGTPNSFPAKRVRRLSFFAILPLDIEADIAERAKAERGELADFSKAMIPVLIGCRSFSFKAGQEVLTWFTQAAQFKQDAWKYSLELGCRMQQNEKGTFFIFEASRAKPLPVPKEHWEQIKYWADLVGTTKLSVDESQDEEAGGVGGQAPGGKTQF